jgi:asparagine synthase (glutamine-hydrolysing)
MDHPQVGLVHRRLAILDLDLRANQPFCDDQGRWLVFNGEIYNFRELRAELSKLKPEYRWRTNCDTEVLLVSYASWGGDCVRHLDGMFAFAIWDEPEWTLFLARDRMGQKPLYVARSQADADGGSRARCGAIAFASEVQALFPLGWTQREIHEGALVEYLSWGHTSSAQSIYRGIDQLTPGSIQVAVDGRVSPSVGYWPQEGYPDGRPHPFVSDSQAIASTRELVMRAVKNQLVADVPVGCFLSGGVDSSIVAAAMKAVVPRDQRVLTFSMGFDDPRYDEREYAAKVSSHLNTEHRAFTVRPDAAVDLPRIAAAFGEPFGDSSALPTYYLSRETRQHVKVTLSGDGGDELFCGYDRYGAMLLSQKLRRAMTPVPWSLLTPLVKCLPGGHPKSRWERARRFASSLGMAAPRRYAGYLRLFDEPMLRRLFHPDLARSVVSADRVADLFGLAHWNTELGQVRIANPLLAAMASDRMLYLPDDLLTKLDRCSMQFALEVRSPFMDHHLVQFAAALKPSQLRHGGAKRMLRDAFAADLPDWVFKRKKMGFAVPIGEWFRGDLRSMLRDHLFAADSFASSHFAPWVLEWIVNEHEQQKFDHSQRLYALLMLELWWKSQRAWRA